MLYVSVPLRLDDSLSSDMPGRDGDVWRFQVDVDTGKIKGWPEGRHDSVYLFVRDAGTYTLFDRDDKEVWNQDKSDYVPEGLLPNSDAGDAISMVILPDGTIEGFLDNLNLTSVFE